jgi:hypothetical protein
MALSYRRISGEDLARGIEAASISPAQFAVLYGIPSRKLDRWLTGQVEVPHAVALFVGLIADPLILEKALLITKYMVEPQAAAAEPAEVED